MINIVIFCSGDQAKIVFSEIVKYKKYKILGFVDETKKRGTLITEHLNKKYYTIGKISENIGGKNNLKGIIANGLNFKRQKIYKDIIKIDKNFKFETIISKNAVINSNVSIGDGTLIVSGAIINYGTKIGNHCIINTSSSIDHDNFFEDFSSVGPGVITGGHVIIRKNSFIGTGSTIKQKVEIKSNTVVGAKSFVNKNCEKNSVYYGMPAKKIKTRLNSENYF